MPGRGPPGQTVPLGQRLAAQVVVPRVGVRLDHDAFGVTTACPGRGNSRLSCQLPVSGELDGLVVELPESRYQGVRH